MNTKDIQKIMVTGTPVVVCGDCGGHPICYNKTFMALADVNQPIKCPWCGRDEHYGTFGYIYEAGEEEL
jgi:hypothetical protein